MFAVLILIFVTTVGASEVYIEDQSEYEKYEFSGRKPKFDKALYSARIVNDVIEINDEPVTLLRCGFYPFDVRITMDNTSSYSSITTSNFTAFEMDCPLFSNFSIDLLGNYRLKKNLFNIFKVQVVYHPYIVAEASILAINSPNSFVYNINDENHLILNYAWSVTLLIYFTLTILMGVICLTIYIVKKIVRKEYYSVTNIII